MEVYINKIFCNLLANMQSESAATFKGLIKSILSFRCEAKPNDANDCLVRKVYNGGSKKARKKFFKKDALSFLYKWFIHNPDAKKFAHSSKKMTKEVEKELKLLEKEASISDEYLEEYFESAT